MATSTNEQILETFLAAHARLTNSVKDLAGKLGAKAPELSQSEFQTLIDSATDLLKESVKLSVLLGVKLEAAMGDKKPAAKKTTAKKTTAKKTTAKKTAKKAEEVEEEPKKTTRKSATKKAAEEGAPEAAEEKPARKSTRKTAAKKVSRRLA